MPKPSPTAPHPGVPAGEPPLGDAARDMAFRRLARQARLFPEFDLRPFDTAALDDRDAAFAHAIYDAVVRRWLTIAFLLQTRLKRPLSEHEPRLVGALLAGAAQLLLLDRVPAHAAINHAVEWAKQRIRPDAGKLVNAVLRRIAELSPQETDRRRERCTDRRDEIPLADGSALALTDEILPDDDLERLGVATSMPINLLARWTHSMPVRRVRSLAMHGIAQPPIVLNTAHATAPLDGIENLAPHSAPGHHVFTGDRGQLISLLESRPDVWVQDPASSLAVGSVIDLKPRLVADLCAGQGTKTRQLAAAFPEARILATDVHEGRLATLRRVFEGSDRIATLTPAGLRAECLGKADLILLDVPCSNTGVLARRPEARYRFDDDHLDSLVGAQRQIVADSIPLLAATPRRGMILYSTCSLEAEENEQQIEWARKWHGFEPARQNRRPPGGGPAEPAHAYSDGSFAALLG